MIRTQIQLPDELYRRAKQVAQQREISLAEMTRRGLELFLARLGPSTVPPDGWQLPTVAGGGIRVPLESLHDIAVDQYLKALEELPTMDGQKKDITYNLANCYETLGDQEKALTEFKKIIAVDIGFKDVRQRVTRKQPPK